MPMALFHSRFGELALRETRVFMIPESSPGQIPAGSYGLFEMFCDEPGCDCWRALIQVREQKQPDRVLATFTYGWGTPEFYKRKLGAAFSEDAAGVHLEAFGEQSAWSDWLLELFRSLIESDADYAARIQRHYKMFKQEIDKARGGKQG